VVLTAVKKALLYVCLGGMCHEGKSCSISSIFSPAFSLLRQLFSSRHGPLRLHDFRPHAFQHGPVDVARIAGTTFVVPVSWYVDIGIDYRE